MTDLTFIEDGNNSRTSEGLINFDKNAKVAREIRFIQQYQQTPYCLASIPIVQDWLLQNINQPYDEGAAFAVSFVWLTVSSMLNRLRLLQLSLKREPRDCSIKDIV